MNSKDPIENLFKENQHGLDEFPRPALWEKIEAKLEEREERTRGIFLWWKYIAAAVVVFLLSWSLFFIANQTEKQTPESIEVVLQPVDKSNEINSENKTEILDRIEKEQPVIAFENNQSKDEGIRSIREMKAPVLSDVANKYDEMQEVSAEKASVVTVGTPPNPIAQKSSANAKDKTTASTTTIDAKMLETRRLGNSMNYDTISYISLIKTSILIAIPIESETFFYELTSKEKDSFILKNTEVKFPQEVKFVAINDTILLEFSGKRSKRNSKKSKQIQQYFEQKKSEIFQQISDSK